MPPRELDALRETVSAMASSTRRRLGVLSASIAPENSAGSRFANPEDWALPTHPSPAEPSSGCKLVCGTNNFGTRITDVAAVLQRLTELGISEIDTARAYNAGKSEDVLGAALPSVPAAGKLPLASKVTWMKLGYEQVKADLAASLKSLGRSRLDIYYLHAPDHTASLTETLRAVHECHQDGLFTELGISNFRGWQLLQIIQIMKEKGWGPLPTVYQGAYNAVQRDAEKDILPLCRLNGMRFYGYSPLARGVCIVAYSLSLPLLHSASPLRLSLSLRLRMSQVLTGKFHQDSATSASDANPMQQRYLSASMGEALAGLQTVCNEHAVELKAAALRWLVYHSALDPAHGDKVRFLTTRVSTVRSETLIENCPRLGRYFDRITPNA